jgi:hypothetical protein
MQAYKIIARCTKGNQRVQQQQLDGTVITDYSVAWQLAEQLAHKQTAQTNQPWVAVVETYTVGRKPGV